MPEATVVESIERTVYSAARSILAGKRPRCVATAACALSHAVGPHAQAKACDTLCRLAPTRIKFTSRSLTASCVQRRRTAAYCRILFAHVRCAMQITHAGAERQHDEQRLQRPEPGAHAARVAAPPRVTPARRTGEQDNADDAHLATCARDMHQRNPCHQARPVLHGREAV